MATFKANLMSGTHIITASGGVNMFMLVRKKKEYFTDFIAREAKEKGLKVVINGSFIDLTFAAKMAVTTSNSPLDPSESSAVGHVIQEGKILTGTSATGKFHFSQNTCGVEKFSTGLGNPPQSSCSAVGGIAPIVANGLAYGAQNLYKSGVAKDAPITGDVGEKHKPFLLQKSNAMFSAILGRGNEVGKTAIGYSSTQQKMIILSQEDGKTGLDANGIRNIFLNNLVDNAAFLDCSDSATLYYDGTFLVKPGNTKNEFLTIAVGFK